MVEVQKREFYFFAFLRCADEPSAGIGVAEVQQLDVFAISDLNPLRGSAWSRYNNSRFFAISDLPTRPSAGIGVVEVQKLVFFFFFGVFAVRG